VKGEEARASGAGVVEFVPNENGAGAVGLLCVALLLPKTKGLPLFDSAVDGRGASDAEAKGFGGGFPNEQGKEAAVFAAGAAPKENGVPVFVEVLIEVDPKVNAGGLTASAPREGLSSIRSEGGIGSGVLALGGSDLPKAKGWLVCAVCAEDGDPKEKGVLAFSSTAG